MRWIFALPVASGAAMLAVFGAPVTAALWLLSALVLSRGRWILGWLPLVPSPGTAVIEYPRRIEPLAARYEEGGPDALTWRDCASVWVLHLGMGVLGMPLYPEAGRETLGLLWSGEPVRAKRSSFPAAAVPVRALVDGWEEVLPKAEEDAVLFRPRRVVIPRTQMRHALALDPVTLSGSAVRHGDRWQLDLVAAVPIDYPPKSTLPLFSTPAGPIRVHEGLFHALEARGWLFPYTAEYRWSTFVDDPS